MINQNKKTLKIQKIMWSRSKDNENIFKEELDSPEPWDILYNCLSKLENKVKEIFDLPDTTKESQQIIGAGQLEDLAKSVIKKKDDFQEQLKGKDEVINSFCGQVSKTLW